ncbi:TetR/AcrR family transcriptional regulator [Baekduia soli]|uniref:TetR/AcrR family transcriptional regulator n=1 Tax=Baekduia soli TaxID=496014 RepID=A0A5B8U0E1_9ACTN|nr:TetR/AcrR family transcriptional regulator [Baekduia soli]QEC46473.1 TetR/AcrR family transcriptional regulator [Baekduia soli]
MPATDADSRLTGLSQRPKRADAARNYDKLVAAAREAFAQDGEGARLDDIAKRAGVGPGTLYRNFPTRQHLLEAVYVDEVEAIARAADALADHEPWDALRRWTRQFVDYVTTKRAIGSALLTYIDRDSEVFRSCRGAVFGAGDALLERARAAGEVRDDVAFADLAPLLGGIAAMQGADPATIDRSLDLVLDGLRYRPPAG